LRGLAGLCSGWGAKCQRSGAEQRDAV